jgi:hypothetical protein
MMVINFKAIEDKNLLRQVLEEHLREGTATIEDVQSFCEINELTWSGPHEHHPIGIGDVRKHEIVIYCKAPAPGAKEFFKFSNWKNVLKFISKYHILTPFLIIIERANWRINFFFDNDLLSEIEVYMDVSTL